MSKEFDKFKDAYKRSTCEYRHNQWVPLCDHVENIIILPFVAIQMSMVVFLLVHGRKEKTFRQAFYVFFVAVTCVDCSLVVLRRRQYYSYYPNYTNYEFFSATLNDVTEVSMPALAISQSLFHLTISANRFTAFAFPLWQTRIWRPLVVLGATVIIALMSSLFGATTLDERSPFDNQSDLSSGFTSVANVLACAISLVLNACTVTVLMAVRGIAKFRNKGPELRLFVHSLVMFSMQLLVAFQLYFVFFDHFGYVSQPFGFSWAFEWALDGGSLPTSSELFGVNSSCVKDGGCGFLYGVLAGRDVLLGALTVGNLTRHVFSLSGSIFLLAMSGHVRKAYFGFFFKCLRRRQKVHVVRVTPANSTS